MDNAIPSSTHMNDIDPQNLLDDPVIPQPPPNPVIPPDPIVNNPPIVRPERRRKEPAWMQEFVVNKH